MKKKINYKKGLSISIAAFFLLILIGTLLNFFVNNSSLNPQVRDVEQTFREWMKAQVDGDAETVCSHITVKDLQILASSSTNNSDNPKQACIEIYKKPTPQNKEEEHQQKEITEQQKYVYDNLIIKRITLNDKNKPITATIEYQFPEYQNLEEDTPKTNDYTIKAIKNNVWQFELEKTSKPIHAH